MKNKVKLKEIKAFWSDPNSIQNQGQNPQYAHLFPCFLKARQAVSDIMKQEEELINSFKKTESELIKKYAKGISVRPSYPPSPQNPNPELIFEHHFEPIENYDLFTEEINKASKVHQKEYADFCNLEHEIDVEYCPYDKYPRLDLFPLEKQKAYQGFCIEPEQPKMKPV
ncbi:MAG: hypothetical protein ACYDHY_19160 [Acidiferrobacterales bacterium]